MCKQVGTRAKMVVTETKDAGGGSKAVTLECRYDETIPEDRRFFQYTPSGKLDMLISNTAVLAQMEPGAAFYVELTPIPKAA